MGEEVKQVALNAMPSKRPIIGFSNEGTIQIDTANRNMHLHPVKTKKEKKFALALALFHNMTINFIII